jgi:DNA transposition AAA+ family ATPase
LSELNDFLIDQYAKKYRPILLIDEAQNLSPELLEEIRLLSNLETDRAKLLQIILVGQPEMNKTLMLPEMMQLRQRININYHISPLTIDETVKYIKHRLAIAGNPSIINFQGAVTEFIYKFSRGIPRLINILCDLALLTSYVEGKKEVSDDIIREVVHDLESRDFSNISHDADVSEPVQKNEDSAYRTLAGDIAVKIIEIESAVKKSIEEIVSLSRKIDQLEAEVTTLKRGQSDKHLEGLFERVSRLEHMSTTGDEMPLHRPDDEGERSLSEQVDSLKKILNDVNKKLGKS